MACQALGRCRICARKHKIAVFGGEENQHFFIEKANLRLIILNTVCVICIEKIERFIKKMDLDMTFNDFIKEEDGLETNPDPNISDSINAVIKKVTKNSAQVISSQESGPMDVEHPVQTDIKSVETEASIASRNRCIYVTKTIAIAAVTQTRPQFLGDSQSVIKSPRQSLGRKIGQKCPPGTAETSSELDRKRVRNISKVNSADRDTGRKSEGNGSPQSFLNEQGECLLSGSKKGGRFLCCDFCKKEFTHAGDLNKHRRKHTGEKPYECNECQRKFAHASNLARHQRVHSGERPFVCIRCDRTFTRRDKLAIHVAAGKCQSNSSNDENVSQATIKLTRM